MWKPDCLHRQPRKLGGEKPEFHWQPRKLGGNKPEFHRQPTPQDARQSQRPPKAPKNARPSPPGSQKPSGRGKRSTTVPNKPKERPSPQPHPPGPQRSQADAARRPKAPTPQNQRKEKPSASYNFQSPSRPQPETSASHSRARAPPATADTPRALSITHPRRLTRHGASYTHHGPQPAPANNHEHLIRGHLASPHGEHETSAAPIKLSGQTANRPDTKLERELTWHLCKRNLEFMS